MTVAELIEELRALPQHHPVLCDLGLRYPESISVLDRRNPPNDKTGQHILIRTVEDPRNHQKEWEY